MINIVINNNQYQVPTSWSDIVIEQAIELQSTVENASARVKEYFVSDFEPSAHEPSISVESVSELLDLFIDVISILCKVEHEELRKTDPMQIEHLVDRYLSTFVVSVIFEPVFNPDNITQFEWRGEVLLLPTSGIDVESVPMPFENISAEQFCQATDLHIVGSIRYAALIVALLCQPKDERFCIKKCLKRAGTMSRLPMSIVLEVFFCFRKLMGI